MNDVEIMKLAADEANRTMNAGIGGPFGAAVVKNGTVIAVSSNSVLRDNDPTAHAEVNAIRLAGKVLGTHDLSGCTLYATGSPCPMCMSATIWANIKDVVISGEIEDADAIGFRDDFIYEYLYGEHSDLVTFRKVDRSIAQNLYKSYSEGQKQMY